ncbi:MAG: 30S ribosomal protein S8e [Methanomicrobiales archaeon]|nr:30S ribosomal protein S8e [Methanomicrobiales archaeon]
MLWQGRSVRRFTGGRYRRSRGKKAYEIGRSSADTVMGEPKVVPIRTFGGNLKLRVYRTLYANVSDPKTGRTKRVKIETVTANTANPNFVRRNALTKGAIVKTELGSAKIVSRPGQHGTVNAILLE